MNETADAPAATAAGAVLTPQQRYQQDLQRDGFVADAAQAAAVARIENLYQTLLNGDPEPTGWRRWFNKPTPPPRGLYLWGGVGRGKTYLMDCFYECLPGSDKRRVHFHRFMEDVHDRLRSLGQAEDPLISVGQDLAAQAKVLCFDEFFVSDIADAMILARLLETLFDNGVTLVATSNVAPSDLYRDGLQRAKFLPAIALLEQQTEIINVDGGVDYRLRILQHAEIYHCPLDEAAEHSLRRSFEELAPGQWKRGATIQVNHRSLTGKALADGVGWFEFAELCEKPRGPADYIELARRFNTVLISNVPQLKDGQNDPARRFIHLIDELYDRSVNVILSAAAPVDDLYLGERLAFEFRRTRSRLVEMQSEQYLARPHQP